MDAIAWNNRKLNTGLKIISCLIIILAAGFHVSELTTIHVLFDEFGYTATAAYYAGYDWSSVAGHSAYYGYGYGLLLSLIMRLTQGNMALYYQIGIGMNILMLIGSFLISCNMGKKLCKDIPDEIITLTALLVSFYPNTMAQSNVLWSETILYFLFWVSVWFLIRIFEHQKIIDCIGLSMTGVYMYMIHQRAIAIIIATVMVMSVWLIFNKNKRVGITIAISFVLMMILERYLKADVRQGLWGTGLSKANDFSGQTSKITDIFTSLSGFKALIIGAFGKLYYILTAGLLFLGTFFAGVVENIKRKDYKNLPVYAYMTLCFLGALGISAIFMLYGTRQDTLIYGRYTEYVIGPILFFGILYLWSNRYSKKTYFLSIVITVFTGIIVYIKLKNTGYTVYNMICAIGLSEIFQGGQVAGVRPIIAVILAIILSLLMVFVIKKSTLSKMLLIFCVTLLFWGYTNYRVMHVIAATNESVSEFKDVADELRRFSENGELPVYYVTSAKDFDSRYIEIVQYYMPDVAVQYVNDENFDNVKLMDGIVFLDQNCQDIFELIPEFNLISKIQNMYIFMPEQKMADELPVHLATDGVLLTSELMYVQTGNIMSATEWESAGTPGYIVYGPYITLHEGVYSLSFDVSVKKDNQAETMFVDVCSNGIIYAEEIPLDISEKEIQIQFEIEEMKNNTEFRVFEYEGTQIELSNITLRKIRDK